MRKALTAGYGDVRLGLMQRRKQCLAHICLSRYFGALKNIYIVVFFILWEQFKKLCLCVRTRVCLYVFIYVFAYAWMFVCVSVCVFNEKAFV